RFFMADFVAGNGPWPDYGPVAAPRANSEQPREQGGDAEKGKKPVMSVTVVRMMDDAWAGSCPRRTRAMGTTAPAKPAATMASTMAEQMISTRPTEPLQRYTASPQVSATERPFINPTR